MSLNNQIYLNNNRDRVVYTCVTGKYDNLIQHTYVNPNYDYICFTDNTDLLKQGKVGIWNIFPLQYDYLDNVKNARWHKTHPHLFFSRYTESIWVDSNINIITDRVFQYHTYFMMIPIHFCRDCIYSECLAVYECKKDSIENAMRMAIFLFKKGMPTHYGLNETNLIIRNHNNKSVIKLMNKWWQLIKSLSRRDQLSLSYVLWKNNVSVKDIAIDNIRVDKNNYSILEHNHNAPVEIEFNNTINNKTLPGLYFFIIKCKIIQYLLFKILFLNKIKYFSKKYHKYMNIYKGYR